MQAASDASAALRVMPSQEFQSMPIKHDDVASTQVAREVSGEARTRAQQQCMTVLMHLHCLE